MSKRKRCVWRNGRDYRGKTGGVRRVLMSDSESVLVLVVDPGGDVRVDVGVQMRVTHRAMKRWARSEDKTYSTTGGE